MRLEEVPADRRVGYRAGKFLTASDLPAHEHEENAAFKTVLVDARTDEPVVPNGSLGHRYGDAGVGRWNLDLGDGRAQAARGSTAAETVLVRLPRFDTPDGAATTCLAACRCAASTGTW